MRATRREFLAGSLAALAAASAPDSMEAIRQAFPDVPAASRLTMHWYIFGPAWTVEEGRRQLQLMRDAHAGGVLIFPTYPVAVDNPATGIRNQRYLSPEYLDVFGKICAEARRLGLRADSVIGTGWPYGGPSVAVKDAAKMLRRIRIPLQGAKPATLPPSLREGERRVAVFHVEGHRAQPISLEGDAIPAAFRSGEVQIFMETPTGMQVKRAAVGAEGLVVDHYSRPALEHYLEAVGNPLVAAARGHLGSVFCDSLEVYRTNWTTEFPEVFRARRGYDLIPYLPALFEETHPDSKDLRCDFWRTLSDLASEAFVRPLQQWAHAHGVESQVEAYGTPPVALAAAQHVDIPTGEHYEWKEFNTSRWASSGAHLAGKRVIVAEAWTWLGMPNRFADSLEQLKLCSDLHFLSGINALYAVTYAYSPAHARPPGWLPYFGPLVNHTVPFWPHFPLFADYVNRVAHVLQRGEPVADVAVYLAEEDCMAEAGTEQLLMNWVTRDRLSSTGSPPEFRLKNALQYESEIVKEIITNGYSFDGIDRSIFESGVAADGGRLQKGDGNYSILVLPGLVSIDVGSLEVIAAFIRGGGTVIATGRLPETAYGLRDRERNRTRVRELTEAMFGRVGRGDSYVLHQYGSGKAIFARDSAGSFHKALRENAPDILWEEPAEDVSFVHRRTADADIYFVANTSEREYELTGTFRAGRHAPELWNPRTGRRSPLAIYEAVKGGVRVPFRLGPLESVLLVFTDDARRPAGRETTLPLVEQTGSGWRAVVKENGSYVLNGDAGRREISVSDIPAPMLLTPRWDLAFDNRSIPPVKLDVLRSWTEIRRARFHSGKGIYLADIELPRQVFDGGLIVALDLGRVCETAAVSVNDRDAGVLWMRPYRTENIAPLLKRGANRIRIEVTNLLINKILGMGPVDYSEVYARYGQRFPPGDEWTVAREPLVSGLLGPVKLVFGKELRNAAPHQVASQ